MTKRSALTLVELLVVLAVIGLLLALLFPAVQSVRERVRDATCKNNLHQLNLALSHFCEANKDLPRPVHPDVVGGWTIDILPFIEQGNLHDRVTVGGPVSGAGELLLVPPAILRCPARTTRDSIAAGTMWPGHYVMEAGKSRDSFMLFDAPIDVARPWASGPEVSIEQIRRSLGPHRGAFHYASGHQQGVNRMLPGYRAN